jgi:uncharacterized membrane protein HdeD (DUF308 family)
MSEPKTTAADGERVHRFVPREALNSATVTGGAAVGVGALVLLLPELSLTVVEVGIAVTALVSGVRGLLVLAEVLVRRRSGNRWQRVATGLAAVAVGVLAWFSPETLSTGLVAGGAVVAVVIGGIVLARGVAPTVPVRETT